MTEDVRQRFLDNTDDLNLCLQCERCSLVVLDRQVHGEPCLPGKLAEILAKRRGKIRAMGQAEAEDRLAHLLVGPGRELRNAVERPTRRAVVGATPGMGVDHPKGLRETVVEFSRQALSLFDRAE